MTDFHKWLDSYQQTDSYAVGDVEDDIKAAWNAAKELYKPKWISVEDRLPDEHDYYPVLYKSKTFGTTGASELTSGDKDGFAPIYLGENIEKDVTHWLKLPEIPND